MTNGCQRRQELSRWLDGQEHKIDLMLKLFRGRVFYFLSFLFFSFPSCCLFNSFSSAWLGRFWENITFVYKHIDTFAHTLHWPWPSLGLDVDDIVYYNISPYGSEFRFWTLIVLIFKEQWDLLTLFGTYLIIHMHKYNNI